MTAKGFKFVLLDEASQAHYLMLFYIRSVFRRENGGDQLVLLSKLIFDMAFGQVGKQYKLIEEGLSRV